MHLLPRVLGAITAAHGIVITARPEVLARPCGLTGPSGEASAAARVFCDAADAAVFGLQLPEAGRRPRIAGFALFWAALCTWSGRWASGPRVPAAVGAPTTAVAR